MATRKNTYSEEDVRLGAANALRSIYDLLKPGGELDNHEALSFFAAALYRMSEEASFITLPETTDVAGDLLDTILDHGYVDESEL